MKKITLMLFALVAFCWQSNAQIQIGSGTSTTSSVPITSCYGYTYSQQLFLASEINASGSITELSFYLDAATTATDFSNSVDWVVYLGHSTKTEFTSTTDWEDVTNLTSSYSGTVTFPAEDNWFTITLDTPFVYNGTDNLVLAIDENTSSWNCSMYWQKTDTANDMSIYYRNDSTNPDPTAPPTATGVLSYRANTIFGGITQACPSPSDLTATNITTTSADLGWTENGSASTYNVEVVMAGDAATGAATDTGVANGFTKSGLTENTDYEYYVQAICGGDTSAWVGPYAFRTLCNSFSVPFAETFDSTSTSEGCWTVLNENGDADAWDTNYTSDVITGDENAALYTDYNSGNNDDWLISPTITLTGNERLKFKYSLQSTGEPNDFEVLLSTSGTDVASFTNTILPLASYDDVDIDNGESTELTIDLSAYTGDVNIAWRVPPGGLDGWRLYIDDVVVETIPSCVEPSDLTATNIMTTSADLSWTENGSASLYNVEVVVSGDTPTGAATDTGVANGFTKSGLLSGTTYDYYVQADCTGGDLSAWVGPYTFTTDCEAFSVSFTEDFETTDTGSSSNPTTPDCWSYIDDGTGYAYVSASAENTGDNGYYMYSGYTEDPSLILVSPPISDLTAGNQVRFYAKDLYGYGGQVVFGTLSDPSDPLTFTEVQTFAPSSSYDEYTVYLPTTSTDAYFGFKILNQDTAYGYCYINLDDIVYEPVPSCISPLDLTATDIMSTSAVLSWTENGSASLYNVEVVLAGDTPTGTATDTGVANGFTKTGLTAQTDYEYYVQADCTGGDVSSWTGPFAFSTLCSDITTDYSADMSVHLPDDCWSEAGSGEVADGPMGVGSSDWKGNRAFTDDEGMVINSNVINLYSDDDREWLISPKFDLDALGSVGLLTKVAVTDYTSSGISDETDTDNMGSDDEVQLLMTNDGGATWTNLTTWNAANQPAVTGTNFFVDLSSMSGVVQFAFFGSDGTSDDSEDFDFHVGSFEVSANALSVNSIEDQSTFTYFPNPVKNTLTLNAQNTIENVTMYNMLGQEVLRATPNAVNSELNMSSLQDGAYFVKVTIANVTKTIKVIKQ